MIDRSRFRFLIAHCCKCGTMTENVEDLFCANCRKGCLSDELQRERGHQQQIRWRLAALASKPQ